MALPDGRKAAVNNETDSDGGAKRHSTEVGTSTLRVPFVSAPVEHLWQRNIPDDAAMAGKRQDSWWTIGRPLSECPGWQRSEDRLSSLQMPNVRTSTRAQLQAYFENSWTLTEVLFSALQGDEAFYRPPAHNLRHPLIFYYAHPAVLYINKLRVAGLLSQGVNEHFESIFEVGVDEMSWDDLSRNEMSWPSVAAVNAYRRLVFVVVQNVIERHSCFEDLAHAGEPSAHPSWSLYMAFEHERIHLETSSVLIRELPLRLVSPPSKWQPPHESALKPRGGATHMPVEGTHYPANSLLAQPGGEVRLGKDAGDPFFGWDNEYGARVLQVGAFSATKLMVSNAEFYLFVRDLGYHEPSWWSEEGWKWRSFRNAKQPPFWVPEGPAGLHRYALRLLFHVVPMPWALPCIVNVHEARAYTAWRAARDGLAPGSLRLLTEPEHHLLRDRTAGATHNVSLAFGSECDVDALPTAKPSGVHDAMGNVWCWCEDHFSALPGFTVSRLYEDFSTPCFDGKHHMIMGGSWASTGDLASRFARYAFRPHFHQHAGFRLASSEQRPVTSCTDAPPPYAAGWVPPRSGDAAPVAPGEHNAALEDATARALLQSYALPSETVPYLDGSSTIAMMLRCSSRAASWLSESPCPCSCASGALVIGCGVGDAAFELARYGFRGVLGLEHDPHLLAAAIKMRDFQQTVVSRTNAPGISPTRVTTHVEPCTPMGLISFRHADPANLPPDLGVYDAVMVHDIIDRVPSPRSLLGRMGGARGLVSVGAYLLVTSAYLWDEARTPREAWLGAEPGGESCVSGILQALGGASAFKLLRQKQMGSASRGPGGRQVAIKILHLTLWLRLA